MGFTNRGSPPGIFRVAGVLSSRIIGAFRPNETTLIDNAGHGVPVDAMAGAQRGTDPLVLDNIGKQASTTSIASTYNSAVNAFTTDSRHEQTSTNTSPYAHLPTAFVSFRCRHDRTFEPRSTFRLIWSLFSWQLR